MQASPTVVRPLLLLCFLVDAVEDRHCALLRTRSAAAWKCYARVCGGGVENMFFRKSTPGTFLHGVLFFLTKSPVPLCSPRGHRFTQKYKFTPGGQHRGYYSTCAILVATGWMDIIATLNNHCRHPRCHARLCAVWAGNRYLTARRDSRDRKFSAVHS